MRSMALLWLFIAAVFMAVLMGAFIFYSFAEAVEETTDPNETEAIKVIRGFGNNVFVFFPVVIIFMVSALGVRFVMGNEEVPDEEVAYYVNEPDIDPNTLKVRDAKKILKIRYAKGEIDSLEYSERMSRL